MKQSSTERLRTANTVTQDVAGTAPQLATGDLFGRYRYVSQVGVGGGGSVHLVEDNILLRRVALKILDPAHVARPRQTRRFVHEAQITSQLDHPNIVPVHDLAGAPSYYTMKLVTGTTLADWIAAAEGGGRPPGVLYDLLGALLKVCDAVAFAHSRGILHCDLKPSNIMVGDFGEVYLMDWGSALMQSGTRVSISGTPVRGRAEPHMIKLAPAFMSPEQLAGRHAKLDQRTDVFGLGAVLYAVMTGQAPFDAGSMAQTLARARSGRVRFHARDALREPPVLCRIAKKAMSRRPEDRHQNVRDFKRELEAYVKGGFQLPTRVFVPGAPIIREGERGEEVFIIERGTCRVSKAIGGTDRVLREMGPGGVFGETAALAGGGVRTATVKAVDEVIVRVVSKTILDEVPGPQYLDQRPRRRARRALSRGRRADFAAREPERVSGVGDEARAAATPRSRGTAARAR